MNTVHAAPQFSGQILSKPIKSIKAKAEYLKEKFSLKKTEAQAPALKMGPACDELVRSPKKKDSH